MMETEIILYVQEQAASRDFYAQVLAKAPSLDVPGMTEFELSAGLKLGLMPENGIAKIISPTLPHPARARGIPRCELYLLVEDAQAYCDRLTQAGGMLVSPLATRDWGDAVAYFADPDGHVLARNDVRNLLPGQKTSKSGMLTKNWGDFGGDVENPEEILKFVAGSEIGKYLKYSLPCVKLKQCRKSMAKQMPQQNPPRLKPFWFRAPLKFPIGWRLPRPQLGSAVLRSMP
jgi:catechol 2,3-dioxygenase-like lactoylglutathione lyase family enzyme